MSIDRTQGLNAVSIITYISTFVGFVVYDSTFFYSYKFQNTGTSVKTAQYNSLGSSIVSHLLYKQKQDAVIRYLVSRFITETSRSKQRRLLLSR